MSNCICSEYLKTFGVYRSECPANHDKLLTADLAIVRRELEELRVLHKIAWTNEKELTDELAINKKLLARQCDLAREAETEKARWKTMAQRHNPSGCCCQIDENNGDPKMVEPCAFHAEWRDVKLKRCKKSLLCEEVEHNATMKELETLRGKVRRLESVINSLGGIATPNIDLLEAYRGLCDISQPGVRDGQAKKCTHPQGYIKSVRICVCGLCGEQR